MNDRLALAVLALLTLLSLGIAPWAALNRETGARSAVVLLPERIVDFTGRTEPIAIPGQGVVLAVSILALVAIAAGATLTGRRRYWLWLGAGLGLIAVTAYGLTLFGEAVRAAQQAALEAGANPRRLPYQRSGMAMAAFLCYAVGGLAVLFGLRAFARLSALLDRVFRAVAVPAASILLALVATAVVVLLLQPTAVGRGVEISSPFMALVGRIDTLWYAYQTLFADSLGSLGGFLEALKFTTPLIFTGLAVAFGFRAGLFNIGAPGQMAMGAIFAMVVGVFVPGPRWLILPLAILAAALGGALWGAIPGWLKARFGAHEVINTILMNFIAASLLLFVLSSEQVFTAPALRIVVVVLSFAALAIVFALIRPLRVWLGRSPRVTLAVAGVVLLVAMVVAGLPRPGDAPINLNLPFKAPGSEPKSHEILPEARIPQLPALLGIDLRASPGVNVVPINYGLLIAPVLALLGFALAPGASARLRRFWPRLAAALGVGLAGYLLCWALGWTALPTAIPPTKLNGALLIALAAAVVVYVLLWRTKWGFELRAVGVSPKAAEYGGVNIARNIVLAMAIAGALAGLSATHYVLGGALEDYSLRQALPMSDGFDGIAVALLGGTTPVGVVLAAFLFGVLKHGGSVMNITFSDLTRDVVSMVLALVVLFIAAKGFLPERLVNPQYRPREAPGAPERAQNAAPSGSAAGVSHD
jgi:simple sugar transport system permease protein